MTRGKVLWVSILFCLLFTGMVQGQFQFANAASSQVVELNNEGVKALNAGNFPLAIQKFQAALKIDPSYGLAKENLAICYNNYGLQLAKNPADAIKQFHQAMYLNQNNPTTLSNLEGIISMMHKNPKNFKDRVDLGDQARIAGDFVGAIIEYQQALKIKDDPQIHIKLGDVYRVRDEGDKAISEYQNAAKISDSSDIEVKLGQAYQANKDIPNAIQAYGQALKLKPDDPDVLDALVTGWEEALRENPTAPDNHIGLGQAFQYRGDFDQAAAEYKQALVFDRNNQTAHRLLGSLNDAKKQASLRRHVDAGVDLQTRKLYDQAIDEYKLALQADPNNATVLVNIGSAYQDKEDYDNAIHAYEQALSFDPTNAAATQGIQASTAARQVKQVQDASQAAAEQFKLGNYTDAIAKYLDILKITPQDPAIHFSLGATYQANKDIESAISEYRQAVSFDPKNDDYKKALEAAYDLKVGPIVESAIQKHKAKDYASAIDLYQQALSIRPKDASIWFNLAGAYYAREDYSNAYSAYKKAVDLDPQAQVNDYYLMGVIDENYDRTPQALTMYQQYLAAAPMGQYTEQAKGRIKALTANPKDTIKIKSEAELAKIKEADDAYKQAVFYQENEQWDKAIEQYRISMNDAPAEPVYPYGLGTLFQKKGDIDIALNWYQKAVELAPKVPDYQNALQAAYELKAAPIIDNGVKKQTAGDIQGAIDLYEQALSIVPKNARLWTNLGTAYQNADNFQTARDDYQKGLNLDPTNEVNNLYLIAAIDENFGQGRTALSEYKSYLSKAPMGQYTSAANDRVKALTANPNNIVKLPTSGEIKAAKDASDAFDQAIKLQQQNKFDEALVLYQKANQLVPKEADYAYGLGTCYQAKQDYDNAIQAYQQACTLDPKNKDYPKVLDQARQLKVGPIMDEALKKFTTQDYAGAIALYQQALSITPNNGGTYTNLAAAYQANDDFNNARSAFQKALTFDPKGQIDNWYFIGLIDENASQAVKAIQDYQKYLAAGGGTPRQYTSAAQDRIKVLSTNSNATQKIVTQAEAKATQDAASAFDQGVKLQTAQSYDQALPLYQKAIQLAPNEPAYAYGLGTLYQAKNDIDSAIDWYQKALKLDPKNKQYQQILAAAYDLKAAPLMDDAIKKFSAQDYPGAIASYQKALAITPNNARGYTNLAGAYQAMDDFAHARDNYAKALSLDSKGEADDWYFIGAIDENSDQGLKALQDYQKYLTASPKGQYIDYAQARLKELKTNPLKTQKLTTQAQQKQSGEADASFQNATKLQQDNKFPEALAEYKKAIADSPNNASYWYSLGTCYQAQGNNDEAINAYTKAAQLNPSEPAYGQLIHDLKTAKATPLLDSAFKKQTTKDDKGNYDLAGAIADYEAALKIIDDPTTHLNLGTAYQANNNLIKASSEYRRALQMDSKQCDAHYYLGTLYEAQRQNQSALIEYRKCVQCNPSGGNAAASKERIKALGGR